ncbi:MAG: hypothetical protein LC117_08925 [Bacteroidia bacterium]|nr:hypothetical protein [Bacteroidia bacterium]MCZ2278035.1 hypothetical protein [Bacteroidia bacterium]
MPVQEYSIRKNNMVAFDKFGKLSLEEKAWYLWNGGSFLMANEDGQFRYNLFRINNFYVELIYNLETEEIDKIRAFFSESFLTPYLASIDIDELLK